MGALPTVAFLLAVAQPPTAEPEVGFLWVSGLSAPLVFEPHEGDLILYTTRDPRLYPIFALARSGHPHHVGIVVRDHQGRLRLCEADMKHDVAAVPVEERITFLAARSWHPTIWVRPIR